MMRNLYVTAYVAAPNTTPMGFVREEYAQFADRRGWKVVAESDSALIAPQLRFGEQRAIRGLRLGVRNAPIEMKSRWVVLGISGQSVDLRVAFDTTKGLRPGAPGRRPVQVYACSDRDLAGQLDTARSNELRRAYGVVC
jgi:hypothetical protein